VQERDTPAQESPLQQSCQKHKHMKQNGFFVFYAINTAQRTPQVFQILDTGSWLFLVSIEFVPAKQSVGFKRFTFLQVYLICTYRLARSFPKRNALGTRMHEDGTTGSQDRQNISA